MNKKIWIIVVLKPSLEEIEITEVSNDRPLRELPEIPKEILENIPEWPF